MVLSMVINGKKEKKIEAVLHIAPLFLLWASDKIVISFEIQIK
jgi:hypothetical protein